MSTTKVEASAGPDVSYIMPTLTLKYDPKSFDSLDARAVQFKYAEVKLQAILRAIDALLSDITATDAKQLVLVQYIIYLSSGLFAINESGFNARLRSLENFRALRPTPVTISQVATHVPYDVKDAQVLPLEELPSVNSSFNCLKSFRASCANCLDGYQKRLANISQEILNEPYMDDLTSLFSATFFDLQNDIDLTLSSAGGPFPAFLFPVDEEQLKDTDYVEASLIDIDLHALFALTRQMTTMLARHKPRIQKLRDIKLASKQLQESQVKALPNRSYSLHQIFLWALRLNDLYTIVRRFGRQIYLSNYQHLHDQKFLSQMPSAAFFRSQVLKDIDESFNTAKKNGVLIATITRFMRLNTSYEVNTKNILEFVGFIAQSFTYLEALTRRMQEFGYLWIRAEMTFRRSHDLPQENLAKLNEVIEKENRVQRLAKEKEAMAQKDKSRTNGSSLNATSATPSSATERAKSLAVRTRDSRSSSLSSMESSDSARRVGTKPSKALPTTPAIAARNGPTLARPSSMIFLNENSSYSSLQQPPISPIDKSKIVSTTTEGRRRSLSQPLSFNAAATALKQKQNESNGLRSPNNGLRSSPGGVKRSPSGSLRRTASLNVKTEGTPQLSPLANKVKTLKIDEEGEDVEPAVQKMSANQKFQQHLREASRAGALFAHQKEVLTNVVFDPNNPSATVQKKYTDPPKPVPEPVKEIAPPKDAKESEVPVPPPKTGNVKPTRAQITKLNTQRNSVMRLNDGKPSSIVSGDSSVSVSSQASDVSNTPTGDSSTSADVGSNKKVRFTGVPHYTPEEDAPSSHSSRILKNFAVFKSPLLTHRSHAAFRKKDQLLKKEESILFRQLGHPDDAVDGAPAVVAVPEPATHQTSKISRLKHRLL